MGKQVRRQHAMCRKCGSSDVQTAVWAYINKQDGDPGLIADGDGPSDANYCPGCDECDASLVWINEYSDGTFGRSAASACDTPKAAWDAMMAKRAEVPHVE